MPFGIQPIHVVLVVIVGLVIFGPSKLPDMGRGLGRALTEFRKGSQEMADSFREELGHGTHHHEATDGRCEGCEAENPPGSRFCNGCGAELAPVPRL